MKTILLAMAMVGVSAVAFGKASATTSWQKAKPVDYVAAAKQNGETRCPVKAEMERKAATAYAATQSTMGKRGEGSSAN